MEVIIFSKSNCPHCTQAKAYLNQHGVPYTERNLDNDEERQAFYEKVGSGVRTVPQIFVDRARIGGFHELLKSDVVARFKAGQ